MGIQALRDLILFAKSSILLNVVENLEYYADDYESEIAILKKYKRYPDRNQVLGRKNKKLDSDFLARKEGPISIVC